MAAEAKTLYSEHLATFLVMRKARFVAKSIATRRAQEGLEGLLWTVKF